MIERAARAIHEREPMSWCADDPWDELKAGSTSAVEQYTRMARAAIAAMREPTEEMKSCSDNIHWDYSCHICGGLRDGWEKMIDAALKEP